MYVSWTQGHLVNNPNPRVARVLVLCWWR